MRSTVGEDVVHAHLGVNNATAGQVAEAQGIAPIVSVQNMHNIAHRHDDALIDRLAAEGIAYVPFFPLGGFSPLQSAALDAVAKRLDATPMSAALAWLLQRSPNILLIPGTSSVAHLRENIAGAQLSLSADDIAELTVSPGVTGPGYRCRPSRLIQMPGGTCSSPWCAKPCLA